MLLSTTIDLKTVGKVVVAQLANQSLPTPEIFFLVLTWAKFYLPVVQF